jgi:hypothetical protein
MLLAIDMLKDFNDSLSNEDNWNENGPIIWDKVYEELKEKYKDKNEKEVKEVFNSFKEVTDSILGIGVFNDITYEDYVCFIKGEDTI